MIPGQPSGVSEATGLTRQWLSTVDCAIALGVSDDTVRREIAAGLLRAVSKRQPGDARRLRFRVHVDALAEYVEGKGKSVEIPASDSLSGAGVYFVVCQQFVKIGRVPFDLRCAGFISCDRGAENALEAGFHVRFAAYRHRGEWFRYEADLADYIANLPPVQL